MIKIIKNHFQQIVFIFVILIVTLSCSKSSISSAQTTPVTPTPVTPIPTPIVSSDVACWLTTADKTVLFQKQNVSINFSTSSNQNNTISVDTTQTYQSIDGFGCALTGGSAYLINRLPSTNRDALLKELFTVDSSCIGISYLRISIGASDLSNSVFSYDDIPSGQVDTTLSYFGLGADTYDLIPTLKSIVTLNPAIKILGSPWSAPLWMKTIYNSIGGSLKPAYYDVYAQYLVKYIQAMKAQGIHIDAITPQNEPLNPKNNPSMEMQATEEADFVKNHLGPLFKAANIDTKIIVYDHNCDVPSYPLTILNDPDANKYVDGSAFHLYSGDITALTQVHTAYPDKNVYFTEQWVGGPGNFAGDLNWHIKTLIIGATRNWSKNVIEWNMAADPTYGPHTTGGCSTCLGALTIGTSVTRNVSYYIMAHASKFVTPGSVRIATNLPGNLQNVAFKRPDGKKVLIVLNDSNDSQNFNIQFNGKLATSSLAGGSVATYVW